MEIAIALIVATVVVGLALLLARLVNRREARGFDQVHWEELAEGSGYHGPWEFYGRHIPERLLPDYFLVLRDQNVNESITEEKDEEEVS